MSHPFWFFKTKKEKEETEETIPSLTLINTDKIFLHTN